MSTSLNQTQSFQAFRRRRFSRSFRMEFRTEQASLGHVIDDVTGGFSRIQIEEKHI